jgi:hypothetical protein
VVGDITEVDDVGFDAVAFALDFKLHPGHEIAIFGIVDGGGYVQHFAI